ICVALGGSVVACSAEDVTAGRERAGLTTEAPPGPLVPMDPQPAQTRTYPADKPLTIDVVGYDPAECGIPGSINPVPACRTDADGDGIAQAFDCDDANADFSPNAIDVPCDGLDQNCNGYDDCDRDGDGIQAVFDLDDADRAVGAGPST
ncbi:MAG: putative metal-binding motif-containing protein, partial [Deltaproteobacteria bacterium]|nr:putative metal-binding motif-containing protein [Deltaproteobacteria bacterium]